MDAITAQLDAARARTGRLAADALRARGATPREVSQVFLRDGWRLSLACDIETWADNALARFAREN